jgi:hypothetical protein
MEHRLLNVQDGGRVPGSAAAMGHAAARTSPQRPSPERKRKVLTRGVQGMELCPVLRLFAAFTGASQHEATFAGNRIAHVA